MLKKYMIYVAIALGSGMLLLTAFAMAYIVNALFAELWQKLMGLVVSGILYGLFLLTPWVDAVARAYVTKQQRDDRGHSRKGDRL